MDHPTTYTRRRSRPSSQEVRLRLRYGVTTRRDLLRAIAAEYTEETGERFTVRDADLVLDGMLEAEYQRLEGGAYDPAPAADVPAPAPAPAVRGAYNPETDEYADVIVDEPACRGCDWTASGYTHRHRADLDGPRAGCCAHTCRSTSDVTVAPPAFDDEAAALLEAFAFGGHNPEANDRLRAARARRIAR